MSWFYQFIKGVRYRGLDSDRTFHVYNLSKNGYNVCDIDVTNIAGAEHSAVQKKPMQAVKTHTRHSNAWQCDGEQST
jgi:hypothetical protein